MEKIIPIGVMLPYGGRSEDEHLPAGWLPCDGRELSRDEYTDLFYVLKGAYGEEGNYFNVPDMRGRFLRGVSGATDRDPGRDSREAMAPGGNVGNKVGSVQADAAKYHFVRREKVISQWGGDLQEKEITLPDQGSSEALVVSKGTFAGDWSGLKFESSVKNFNEETRPVNANVNFIIKAS